MVDTSNTSPGVRVARHSLPSAAPNCKGRVRTGCLVCRARKVKCDEQRPTCQKCARLKRTCVYRIPGGNGPSIDSLTPPAGEGEMGQYGSPTTMRLHQTNEGQPAIGPSSPNGISDWGSMSRTPGNFEQPGPSSSAATDMPSQQHEFAQQPINSHDFDGISEQFRQTSQIIYLSMAMDWMAAWEAPNASSFAYFINEVDCPVLSSYDHVNFAKVKRHIAQLGFENTSVTEALLAVQALHRAQVDRLPMPHATAVFQAATASFESACTDDTIDFNVVLVTAFLICLGAIIQPNDDGTQLTALGGSFTTRLEGWLSTQPKSPMSLRLCGWLQLINITSKHPGSAGVLPPSTLRLLYQHVREVPCLPSNQFDQSPEHCLYDVIATPIFNFYLKLQEMSNRVTDVTHYRRSRSTPEDQAEVTGLMSALKTDLANLWETRPAPLQLRPAEIREHFSPAISGPVITLAGASIAAFHSETIVIGRILGDPPFPSDEAENARRQIRAIVDGNWNAFNEAGELHPGLTRPVFVYALESFDEAESQWAVEQMRRIKHPLCRGNFLASFFEAHGKAQREQRRRVTMKYFCYQTFGVPLPFM